MGFSTITGLPGVQKLATLNTVFRMVYSIRKCIKTFVSNFGWVEGKFYLWPLHYYEAEFMKNVVFGLIPSYGWANFSFDQKWKQRVPKCPNDVCGENLGVCLLKFGLLGKSHHPLPPLILVYSTLFTVQFKERCSAVEREIQCSWKRCSAVERGAVQMKEAQCS